MHESQTTQNEWISWSDLEPRLPQLMAVAAERPELPELCTLITQMLGSARSYHKATGGHLAIYQDIAGIYAALCYGITLNYNADDGPDGWLNNVPVYIRVMSPEARNTPSVTEATAPQGHLFVVRFTEGLNIEGKLFPCAFSRQDRSVTTDQNAPSSNVVPIAAAG